MLSPHVLINPFALGESVEALPTYVRLAPRTGHMIATRNPFDARFASRTGFYVVSFHPFLEKFIAVDVTICAGDPVVCQSMTARADACETSRAL